MNRKPPVAVRRILRSEVGFGCPVTECGNPYLYWHHFDPTWEEKEHHNSEGMIALCAEHHKKADCGAYTKEQLQKLKVIGKERNTEVRGKFDWMRNKLLTVVGSIFYYEIPIILEFRGNPIIWFNRDADGYFLLNLRMLSKSQDERIQIEDNYWISRGNPIDLESPPSGKLLKAVYNNGDMLKIEFTEVKCERDLIKRYPASSMHVDKFSFPVTLVEINKRIGGTNIEFTPQKTNIGGSSIYGGLVSNGRVGISFG